VNERLPKHTRCPLLSLRFIFVPLEGAYTSSYRHSNIRSKTSRRLARPLLSPVSRCRRLYHVTPCYSIMAVFLVCSPYSFNMSRRRWCASYGRLLLLLQLLRLFRRSISNAVATDSMSASSECHATQTCGNGVEKEQKDEEEEVIRLHAVQETCSCHGDYEIHPV